MYKKIKIIFSTLFLLLSFIFFSLSNAKAMNKPESPTGSDKYERLPVKKGKERRFKPKPTHKRESSMEHLQILTQKKKPTDTSENKTDVSVEKVLYTLSRGSSPIHTPLTTPIGTPKRKRSRTYETVPLTIEKGKEKESSNEKNVPESFNPYFQGEVSSTLKEEIQLLCSLTRSPSPVSTPRKRRSRANSESYERVPIIIEQKEGNELSNKENTRESFLKRSRRVRIRSNNEPSSIKSSLDFPYQLSRESSPLSTPKNRSMSDSEWYDRVPVTTSQISLQTEAQEGDADAMNDLGVLYLKGEGGFPQDEQKALQWFHCAAEKNHPTALYNLGKTLMKGIGGKTDPQKACIYYKLAANKGFTLAQYELAICYKDGVGVEKKFTKAFNLFYRAALDGHALAQYNLALLHEAGKGTPKNEEEALKWALKAAINKLADASVYLGMVYYHGLLGQKKSISTARCHFRNAIKRGCSEARVFLNEMEKEQ